MIEDIGGMILFLALAIGIPKLCFEMMKTLLLLPSLEHGEEKDRVIACKKRVDTMFYLDTLYGNKVPTESLRQDKKNQNNP
ncbi:hypothetical protein V2H45_21145 [Tumidithrix elongata RA019]|uniref:Uncharacterized protein n=1 Tax=Tumidithrix elongata BACA0141 TaxID=2716417 RepID=A0AAW9PWA4_9CYAN|nr:hypothetical protein [Tumidithrix elongata RA019]